MPLLQQQELEGCKGKILEPLTTKSALNEKLSETRRPQDVTYAKKCLIGRDRSSPDSTSKTVAPLPSSALDTLLKNYSDNIDEDGRLSSYTQFVNDCPSTGPSESDDRICPMCQAVFPKAIPLAEFEAHVMEHFRSEEFEIIAQEPDLF